VNAYRAAEHKINTYHHEGPNPNRTTYIWNPVIEICLQMTRDERQQSSREIRVQRIYLL
jgi:hypothetical protein